jgi:hypothetical protein
MTILVPAVLTSAILPNMGGAPNTANLNLPNAQSGTAGEFGGSFIVFHPQLANGCALKIQINR